MRRITTVAMVVVLLAFTGAACGGDDDDASDTTQATDDGSTTDDGGDTGGDTGTDVGAGFLDEDCQFLLAGAFLNPIAATSSGTDPDFEDTADQLDAIADEAPDEISDAMATLAEGYAQIAEVFKDVDLSDPSSFQDPEVASKISDLQEIVDDDYQAAATEVSTYISENCSG
jgi:hypothetical protein